VSLTGLRPFDMSGCVRGEDGILRYSARPSSLVAMLRHSVERAPDQLALVEVGGGRLTYREMWDRAARVAGGLRAGGVGRGDRVAIRLANGLDWCLAYFGAQLAGAIAVPVNTRFTAKEADYVVSDSGSRFVFEPSQPLPSGQPLAVEDTTPDDVAAIFYTSGTTGFPKGALLTHEGLLSNVETCRRVDLVPFHVPVRTLVSVPLFHVTGCNSQLLPTCEAMSTTVIMPSFDVQQLLRVIASERIDVILSVPAVFWTAINQENFSEFDTSSVRWIGYGGAPIAPELIERILEAFPNARVANAFGLTETSGVATCLPHDFARLRPESVGFAAPVDDLRLDDEATGDVGELLVRGPNVIKGYWNKPDATAAAIAEGWLRTGDIARLDGEGFVQILDRKGDMVNRGGEKVYCVEVENALATHPAVFESAVMGVPDAMMGEKVGAVVVLKPGCRAERGEIVETARAALADFKVPQYVVMRSEPLPRNPGGKILKKALREAVSWGPPLW
jgi:acyl-CoA synthetase (AMP-forming)/AMP-acid ligase II